MIKRIWGFYFRINLSKIYKIEDSVLRSKKALQPDHTFQTKLDPSRAVKKKIGSEYHPRKTTRVPEPIQFDQFRRFTFNLIDQGTTVADPG